MSESSKRESSKLDFHQGATLIRVATTYPTIQEVLLETIQNALDKRASRIDIVVNQKSRSVSVRDNGDGVERSEFERALASVGRTIKKEDALGRFGLGLVSPVGKCRTYTFTSTPRADAANYREWNFSTEEIAGQAQVSIPCRPLTGYRYGQGKSTRANTYVPWRTQVRLEDYTPDKYVGRLTLESLAESVIVRYSLKMRKNKAVVHAMIIDENGNRSEQEIQPKDYSGEKLPELRLGDIATGRTTFRMFLARKTAKGRQGRVVVGEEGNDFRIAFSTFIQSLPDSNMLSREVVQALTSGTFEGEILSTCARFHANRRGFEANDNLFGLCLAIQTWFDEHGDKVYKDTQEAHQEERYQQLGQRSMMVLEALLLSPEGAGLNQVIEGFRYGTIGSGHAPKRGRSLPFKSLRVNSGADTGHGGNLSSSVELVDADDGDGSEPEGELPKGLEKLADHPLAVAGPKGQHRKRVRSNSLGLILAHEPLETAKLCNLDQATGVLTLNVRHPLWVQCKEKSDRVLMGFQEYLMVHALTIASLPEDWQSVAELSMDASAKPYVFALVHGDSIAGRAPGRKKGVPNKDTVVKRTLRMAKNPAVG